MLTQLNIRDFAIVDRIDLTFRGGLTALTGETGAGKSILVDALALALGARAGPEVVRHGAQRAEVTAIFDLQDSCEVAQRLRDLELQTEESDCIIRRVIPASGRSRAFINGQPVPVQTVRDVTLGLVEIHGQHAHQRLLSGVHQRQILDSLGTHQRELETVAVQYRRLRELSEERTSLLHADSDRASRLSYVEYQLEELQALALGEGELARLESEHRRLSHASEIAQRLARVRTRLTSDRDDAVQDALRVCLVEVEQLSQIDPQLEGIRELIEQSLIHLDEASASLRTHFDGIDLDPTRLAVVETRLDAIHDLARKHRISAPALAARTYGLAEEAQGLRELEARVTKIDARIDQCMIRYREAALVLHERRVAVGLSLGESVSALMRNLGMPHGCFSVRVDPLGSENTAEGQIPELTAHGLDVVQFMVSTNPGQPNAPLAKIASGGELSRVSLAIHVVGAAHMGSPSLIFDEVDVGIGGGVAERVGKRLREVGQTRQVLCITHLPQVAAQATSHLAVQKEASADSTRIILSAVEDQARVDEIARMLGGLTITERTVAHAREMLEANGS